MPTQLVIATEWPAFAKIDLTEIKKRMRTPLVFDGRNLLDPKVIKGQAKPQKSWWRDR